MGALRRSCWGGEPANPARYQQQHAALGTQPRPLQLGTGFLSTFQLKHFWMLNDSTSTTGYFSHLNSLSLFYSYHKCFNILLNYDIVSAMALLSLPLLFKPVCSCCKISGWQSQYLPGWLFLLTDTHLARHFNIKTEHHAHFYNMLTKMIILWFF